MLWNKSTDGWKCLEALLAWHWIKMQEINSSWSQSILYDWQNKPRKWLEIQRQQENAAMSCHGLFWKCKQRMLKSLSASQNFYKSIWLSRKWYNKSGYKSCNARENQTGYMPYWSWSFKDRNLHSIRSQNRTDEHLGKNAKVSASNLVCLF